MKQAKDFQANQTVFFPEYGAVVQPAFENVTRSPLTVPGSVLVGMGKTRISEHVNSSPSHRSDLKPMPWP